MTRARLRSRPEERSSRWASSPWSRAKSAMTASRDPAPVGTKRGIVLNRTRAGGSSDQDRTHPTRSRREWGGGGGARGEGWRGGGGGDGGEERRRGGCRVAESR